MVAMERRENVSLQLFNGALGNHLGDSGAREKLMESPAQLQIRVNHFGVIATGLPARPPRLVEAEAKSERVNLLPHDYSFAFLAFGDGVVADFCARARFGRGASAPGVVATATTLSGRSDTCTVRCAVRFSTR